MCSWTARRYRTATYTITVAGLRASRARTALAPRSLVLPTRALHTAPRAAPPTVGHPYGAHGAHGAWGDPSTSAYPAAKVPLATAATATAEPRGPRPDGFHYGLVLTAGALLAFAAITFVDDRVEAKAAGIKEDVKGVKEDLKGVKGDVAKVLNFMDKQQEVNANVQVALGALSHDFKVGMGKVEIAMAQMVADNQEVKRRLADPGRAQTRSRDLLARAKEEMALQEAWADEVRELWVRAEMEGVDIADVGEEEWVAEDKESEASRRADSTERTVVLGRQLLYLTHSTYKSETRLRALLHQLSTTRTSHVSQAALAQLRDETPTKQLTEEQLNELHAQWLHMQSSHQAEAQHLLGKLVGENNELKERLEKAERDLKDVRAGRKADEEELRKAEKEIARLTGGGQTGLAVAILDLEADLFSPQVLHHHDSAGAAAEALHHLLRESLRSLPAAEQGRNWQFIAFVFWHRNGRFVQQLISNGFFASIRDFDDFILKFNRAHPLFMLIVDQGTHEQVRQRERAFALLFARHPLCNRLLLGRWAYDLPLAEMLAPAKTGGPGVPAPKVTFPDNVRFVEPYIGFYLPGQLLRRDPQTVGVEGVLRVHPLTDGRKDKKPREVDYSRPLWQQDPPICLDHYLSSSRCADERCAFSHSYRIPPDVLEALRFELRRTPCPLVVAGYECFDGTSCDFAHVCPRGARCPRQGCDFTAPSMHPPAAARVQTLPTFTPKRSPTFAPAAHSPRPAPTSPPAGAFPSAADLARHAAGAPSSTRSALARLLAGAASPAPPLAAGSPAPPTSLPQAGPAKVHHLRPSSPFGHPLSLADDAAASVPPTATGDAVDLTDEELARLLAKVRAEEEEYARGLREDPFVGGAQGSAGGAAGRTGNGAKAGGAVGAANGDGRAAWEAAFSGRGGQGVV
ncbi:hypothetical protein JCM10450v2_002047 [Rhodotorula kratochvilovae]